MKVWQVQQEVDEDSLNWTNETFTGDEGLNKTKEMGVEMKQIDENMGKKGNRT